MHTNQSCKSSWAFWVGFGLNSRSMRSLQINDHLFLRSCLLDQTFGLFRACSGRQIKLGFWPSSGFYFPFRTGFDLKLVSPFKTLIQITANKNNKKPVLHKISTGVQWTQDKYKLFRVKF